MYAHHENELFKVFFYIACILYTYMAKKPGGGGGAKSSWTLPKRGRGVVPMVWPLVGRVEITTNMPSKLVIREPTHSYV